MTEDKDTEAIWREISAIRTDISKVSGNVLQITQVLSTFLTKHENEHEEIGEALKSIAKAMEAINNRVEKLSRDLASVSPDVQ